MTDVVKISIHKGPDQLGRYYFCADWVDRGGRYRPQPSNTDGLPVGYRRGQFFFGDLAKHIESWERTGRTVELYAIDAARGALEAFEATR